jgi:hypothetical protein
MKPLRVKLDLTMREAGVLHHILSLVEGGDVQEIRRRNIKLGRIFNKLITAEDLSLENIPNRQMRMPIP